jgi:hypothetical protein
MLPMAAWCGDVRLRVAQFLANLWQGACVVVYGTNTGANVPAALDHNDWHLRCTAGPHVRDLRCLIRTKVPGLHAHPGWFRGWR